MIAKRLRQRREELNYKQGAFMTRSTLQQWESGKTPTAFPLLAELARHYKVSADWLLGLTNDPAPADNRELSANGAAVLEAVYQLPESERAKLAAIANVLLERERAEQRRWREDMLDQVLDLCEQKYGEKALDDFLLLLQSGALLADAPPPEASVGSDVWADSIAMRHTLAFLSALQPAKQ